MMNNKLYFQIKEEMNRRFPQKGLEYRNGVVATAIANGNADKLTEDWLRRTLLMDIEDGFIEYEQAVEIRTKYFEAIEEMKKL